MVQRKERFTTRSVLIDIHDTPLVAMRYERTEAQALGRAALMEPDGGTPARSLLSLRVHLLALSSAESGTQTMLVQRLAASQCRAMYRAAMSSGARPPSH